MRYFRNILVTMMVLAAWTTHSTAARADGSDCSGWIAVESEPVDGVRVILDGRNTGKVTPTTLKNVPCGAHTIEGSKRHYQFLSWSAVDAEAPPEAAVPFGKRARAYVRNAGVARIKLRFKKNFGRVEVNSAPPGAEVELDGKAVGTTPLTIEPAAPGEHSIRLTLPDYREAKQKITVRRGRTLAVDLTLSPAFGEIQVSDVKPSGAMVYFNGDAVGEAPVSLKRIWTGDHTVRVEREGYYPFEKHFKLSDGQTVSVKAELRPRPGPERSRTRIRHVEEPAGSDPVMTLSARPATPLRERLAWVSAGVGAASAVAATTLFALGFKTESDADALVTRFRQETDSQRRQALQAQVYELDREAAYQKTAAWICTGASVVAAGLSLYLFLTAEPDRPSEETHVGLQAGPTPSGAWVGLAGRF